MVEPYYQDDHVTLYHGDCREIAEWLSADVLIMDPPYGIGWKRGLNAARGSRADLGIQGDADTSVRDTVLALWGDRPAVIFGSFYAPEPKCKHHVLVYRKPPDSGVYGTTIGWRRDLEPIYLVGAWPALPVRWSSLVETAARSSGNPVGLASRYGHPHAKPVDVMAALVERSPAGGIADPTCGSGSTLVAAKYLGRRAIGVELEEHYCEKAATRLSTPDLFAGSSGEVQGNG